jgi:hypothetical protein
LVSISAEHNFWIKKILQKSLVSFPKIEVVFAKLFYKFALQSFLRKLLCKAFSEICFAKLFIICNKIFFGLSCRATVRVP